MDVTRDDVEFHAARRPARATSRRLARHERASPRRPHRLGRLKVTQARVVVSEWTKLRSLRSTLWSLLVAVVFTIGLPALFAAVTARTGPHGPRASALDRHPLDIALPAVNVSQLAIGVLGVLVITGEYSTGMIRATLRRRAEAAARAVGEGRRVRRGHLRADAAGGAHRRSSAARRSCATTTSSRSRSPTPASRAR